MAKKTDKPDPSADRFIDDGIGLIIDGVRIGIDPIPESWTKPAAPAIPNTQISSSGYSEESDMKVRRRLTGPNAGNPRQTAVVGREIGRALIAAGEVPVAPATPDAPAPATPAAPAATPAPSAAGTGTPPPFADGEAWRALMLTEGIETGDNRMIEPGATTFRDFPMPFMWQPENQQEHDGSVFVGQLTRTVQSGADWWGFGSLDVDGENGAEFLRVLQNFGQFGVSVDMDQVDVEYVFPEQDVTETSEDGLVGEEDLMDLLMDTPSISMFVACRVMGLTSTPFPAFPNAFVELNPLMMPQGMLPATVPDVSSPSTPAAPAAAPVAAPAPVASVQDVLVASAIPLEPPRAWFTDPGLTGPTAMTITDDGRVYGHLALWGTCHTAWQGTCVTAPHSQRDYSDFHLGAVRTAEGDDVPCGHITLGTGHAARSVSAMAAAAHYDHTGTQVALIRCGEDKFGIWFAGALEPATTPQQVRTLRSAPLSGDWRTVGGSLELVASLAVNVPGFAVPRVGAYVSEGRQLALTAAGAFDPRQIEALHTANLRSLAAEALDARIGRSSDTRLSALDSLVHLES